MKLSLLKDFFEDSIDSIQIIEFLKDEVSEYQEQIKKKGSSAPITVVTDSKFVLGKAAVIKLCTAFKNADLSVQYIDYIVSGLQMCKQVEIVSHKIEVSLSLMCDPEVNGELTNQIADEIIFKLSST